MRSNNLVLEALSKTDRQFMQRLQANRDHRKGRTPVMLKYYKKKVDRRLTESHNENYMLATQHRNTKKFNRGIYKNRTQSHRPKRK